ncbi:MAG: glycosyltransferase family A protein [Gemmatimonadaceae bacterium]|nr:glycosyltransferase family A protein [Gemmatimonadaceae bacterium]
MPDPVVTVIIATYNRPEVLRCTLQSLRAQTYPAWTALVIGDACAEDTARVVGELADARITYVNLASRCGDQSGPNSIGAALAASPLLAFVNHDDLLLPDHLARTVARQQATDADACVAAVVRARTIEEPGASPRVVCLAAPLPQLTGRDVAVPSQTATFEPVSAWLFTTAFVRRVGDWADAGSLYRTPFNDWLLRACAAGARVVQSPAVSVVHMQVHYSATSDAPLYASSAEAHAVVLEQLLHDTPDAVRHAWERDATLERQRLRRDRWRRFRAQPWRSQGRQLWHAGLRALGASGAPLLGTLLWLGRRVGFDGYDLWCAALGRPRGFWRAAALRRRTGTTTHVPADRAALLRDARQQLAAHA